MSRAQGKKQTAEVFYLYGITGRAPGPENMQHPGVDGRSLVKAAACGDLAAGLTAWYSVVDGSDFGEHLAAKMESLEWLAETSVRHQRVVGEIAAKIAIVPARFGTVFRSLENLQAHLISHAESTGKILEKIGDAEEWGVKIYRRKPVATAAAGASSGTDYLRAKAKLKSAEVATEIVQFANELSEVSADAAAGGKLSASQRDVEWHAAFLVKRGQKTKWDAIVRRYARAWGEEREIECTGPWPPYSFV